MKKKSNTGVELLRIFKATILLIISILILDIFRRNIFDSDGGKITILGNFKNSPIMNEQNISEVVNNTDATDASGMISGTYAGFSSVPIKTSEYIGKGPLTVINSQHISQGFYTGLCDLSSSSNYSEYYSLNNYQMFISADVVPNLNKMMEGYYNATSKSNLIVYNTTSVQDYDSLYTSSPESPCGYSVDIAVMSSSGEIIAYDGLDSEGWISENCCDYGFITRYPEGKELQTGIEYSPHHFRYVGLPHSKIMNEKNMCLEEYNEYLKSYTYENPLVYILNDKKYNIYYTPVVNIETPVQVPVSGNYDISGNNYDGYIITYAE